MNASPVQCGHTTAGDVDLRDVARELHGQKEGASRRIDGRDAEGRASAVAVKHEPVVAAGASAVEVVISGPKGRGITMSLPIDEARQQVDGALDANGVTVDLSGVEFGEQVRRSGPRTLLDVADPDGGRVQVRSR